MKMSTIVGSLAVLCLVLSVSGASVESNTDATAVDVQLLEGIIKRLNDTLYGWLSESEETTLPGVVNKIYSHVQASIKLCDEDEDNSASDSSETETTHQDFVSEHIKDSRESKSHAAYNAPTPTTSEPTAIIPY